MKLIKDKSGQGGMISFFIGAMLAVIIALNVAWPVMDSSIYGGEGYATGVLTLTSNASCGDMINITTASGIQVPLIVNITTGCNHLVGINDGRNILVNVTLGGNGSTFVATNISERINSNATLANILTATNTSDGVVTLTYDSLGTTGNSVGTTETMANGSWSGTTLAGGGSKATNNMSTASQTLVEQIPLFLVLVLLLVFVKAVI